MIWLGLTLVTLVVLAPVIWAIVQPVRNRGRRDPALALHRAQLAELDRELAEARLLPEEHKAATIEVQRRLIQEAEAADPVPKVSSRWPLIYALPLAPAAALGIYLIQGQPGMPAEPLAPRQAEWSREDMLISQLQTKLARLPAGDARVYEGYILLGEAQLKRNRLRDASDAWIKALDVQFNPDLAAQAAEARAEAMGQVDDVSANLFKRALAQAPAGAKWISLAQQRLKDAGR